jgi:beta-xylosidase
MKVRLVVITVTLPLILAITAFASASSAINYDVFIEAEDAVATYGFGVVGLPRTLGYSGGKMLNLWEINAPTSSGYYARYPFQVTSDAEYYINIWVQDLETPYSSPFKLVLDNIEWLLNKDTARLLPNQIKYGEAITGYFIGPISLKSGDHNISIFVNERRAYSDKAYNLIVDAIALSQRDPTITEMPAGVRLTVNAADDLGLFSPLTDLSQGGISEVSDPAFWRSVAPIINTIGTSLVRIDHIFDDGYYHVVQKKPNGSYEYDWRRLDAVISEILKTGARPFLCLSYMPLAMSRDHTPYQAPTNFNDWRVLCEELVRHMRIRFNLTGLYYEVWNEPDLKQFWKGSKQDYFDLYQASVSAIKSTDPSAKVGGPAVSSIVMGWARLFLKFVKNLKLQLDFVSLHLYNQDPVTYSHHIQYLKQTLADMAFPDSVEILLTEWNSSGPLDASNDAFYNAGHTAAVLSVFHKENISKAFFFMPKDYFNSQILYGGWGLVTYDGRPKPSFNCFDAYRRLKDGQEIRITSTDNSVKALGVINGTTLKLLLWNYSDKQAFGKPREIQIVLEVKGTPFSTGTMNEKKYLIDSQYSNVNKNPSSPNLQIVDTNSLVGKDIMEETISLENGAVMYIEFNQSLPPKDFEIINRNKIH